METTQTKFELNCTPLVIRDYKYGKESGIGIYRGGSDLTRLSIATFTNNSHKPIGFILPNGRVIAKADEVAILVKKFSAEIEKEFGIKDLY